MYFVASEAGGGGPGSGAGPHHQQYNGLFILLLVYVALLYRSTSKTMLFMRQTITRENILRLTAKAHQALLTYLSNKAFVLLRFLVVALTYVLNKLLKGRPAVLLGEFFTNQTVAWQDQMQGRLEVWLDGQLDLLGEKTKETIKDPYMPLILQRVCDDLVDTLLPDSKRLILNKTDELIRSRSIVTRHLTQQNASAINAGAPSPLAAPWDERSLGPAHSRLPTAATSSSLSSLFDPVGVVLHTVWDVAASPYRIYHSPAEYRPLLTYQYWSNSLMQLQTGSTAAAAAALEDESNNEDKILDAVVEESEDGVQQTSTSTSLMVRHARILALARQFPSRLRAYILHTSAPCDKSSWQCFRDLRWWTLTGIGLLPHGIGTLWWLLLFSLHDKRDEYQVSNFIVSFMVSKFLGGCGLLLLGAFKYYLCATATTASQGENACLENGPRVQEHMDALLFFVQISLVWLCFFLLPMTEPCRTVLDERDLHLVIDMDRVHKKVTARTRGGRLAQMFWWESASVLFVFVLALLAIFLHWETAEVRLLTELFWLKVIFGLLAMPFLLFKVPILSTLLMQVRPTGYDKQGRVVLHARPRPVVTPLLLLQDEAVKKRAAAAATVAVAGKDAPKPVPLVAPSIITRNDVTLHRLSESEEEEEEE